ncbi:D-alanyl-D-alanine carboxypeptidase family protein [Chakrabartyella piscis]|uniref:D-alanyl-D-alanine carboxypeptidase family protein n=1 Tax=Chakrabartyella piscis TaxID=2918914 RepID=UPI002958D8FD|nr:D-alanyl-D-alanine carboxypeptidase family protein [Chakrabartyella piscis]
MKNNKWKKWLVGALVGMMVFSAGCGSDEVEEVADATEVIEEVVVEETVEKVVEVDETALQTAIVYDSNVPELVAEAAILVEQSTGTILYKKNAREIMYPASMTKIITAMVVLDYFAAEELITVGTEINVVPWDSSKAGHIVGETLTTKNLIRGLMIPSGNDSANVLAAAVARRASEDNTLNFTGCEEVFTQLMNDKAAELGAKDTHFTNAHGYHDDDHYTTGYDMALFAKAFLDQPILMEIANEMNYIGNGADNMFVTDPSVTTQDYAWQSHNLLLTNNEYQYAYASGIKTGYTGQAGDCVAAAAYKDDNTLIAIVFNAEDPNRWLDSTALFEYGFNQYEKVNLKQIGNEVSSMPLTNETPLGDDTVNLRFDGGEVVCLPVGMKEEIQTVNVWDEAYTEDVDGELCLVAPLEYGQVVGEVLLQLNGETIDTQKISVLKAVEETSITAQMKYFFNNFFDMILTPKGLLGIGVVVIVVLLVLTILRIVTGNRRRKTQAYSFGSAVKPRRSSNRIGGNKRRGGRRGGRRF